MISKKEVQHIAKLARIGLNEKEIEKMRKELSPILDYFEKLKKVDVSEMNYPAPRGQGIPFRASSFCGFHPRSKERDIPAAKIKPEIHSVEIENVFRDDENQKPRLHQGFGLRPTKSPSADEVARQAKLKSLPRTPRPFSEKGEVVRGQKLLEMAPEKKDGYLKVKSVF